MNINRQRPPKGCTDLDSWLSGVVFDAVRDAREAGLSEADSAMMMLFIARSLDILKLHGAGSLKSCAQTVSCALRRRAQLLGQTDLDDADRAELAALERDLGELTTSAQE